MATTPRVDQRTEELARRPGEAGIVEFVGARLRRGRVRAGAGRGARGRVRQRRHAVVREADADPARLHPAPAGRDGRGRPRAARAPALEGRLRARLRLVRRASWPSTTPATTRTCQVLAGRHPRGVRRRSASRTSRRESDEFLRGTQHPTLGRGYLDCAYAPMVELLGYLDRERVHATTSPPAAAATSCGRSARTSTASRASA